MTTMPPTFLTSTSQPPATRLLHPGRHEGAGAEWENHFCSVCVRVGRGVGNTSRRNHHQVLLIIVVVLIGGMVVVAGVSI